MVNMLKDILKSNLAAIITILMLFSGGSALAIYSNQTPEKGGQTVKIEDKRGFIAVYDSDGNITVQQDPGNQQIKANLNYIPLTDQQLQKIHDKGMNSFKVVNGQLTEVMPGQPKTYIVFYIQDGTIVDVKERTGTETGTFIEIPEVRYNQIMHDGKNNYKVFNGEVLKFYQGSGRVDEGVEKDSNGNIIRIIPPNVH